MCGDQFAGLCGGEGGIRTLGTVARTPHFECGAFDHSATSPQRRRDGSEARPASQAGRLAEGAIQCKGSLAILARRTKFDFMTYSDQLPHDVKAPPIAHARFGIGAVVRHKVFPFRGVVFDIDPVFANSEEWYESIPEEIRPAKDQPFYHLLAENGDNSYVAYVSQQNLLPDEEEGPVDHPEVRQLFTDFRDGRYELKRELRH